MDALTEADAARAYSQAWNRLSPREFIDLLAADVRFTSMWVFEDLLGREAVAEYLTGKMATVRQRSAADEAVRVRAELGTTTKSFPGRECVVLTQGDHASAVALFEIAEGLVKKIDLCIPDLLGVVRSGRYPE